MRLLGLDPGLRTTGWGVVVVDGSRLRHIANGQIGSDPQASTATRLAQLYGGIAAVIEAHAPVAAAVEETFVNVNATSTLKLGLARGVALVVPGRFGLEVAEYTTTAVKKAVVGVGHADKTQVQAMVRRLLPGVEIAGADAADALAVALCHGHHLQTQSRWSRRAVNA
ncbi:MAG: crossover junction endodeoxyribonuclease RuvC [Alphaproteobacteria bacterium]|nr:crossover junction endodeoxyribonuclease RuvC [Alphaproteobacteria bacterium]